jgi:hypothetical protein
LSLGWNSSQPGGKHMGPQGPGNATTPGRTILAAQGRAGHYKSGRCLCSWRHEHGPTRGRCWCRKVSCKGAGQKVPRGVAASSISTISVVGCCRSLTDKMGDNTAAVHVAAAGAGAAAASSDTDCRMRAAIGQLVGVSGAHAGLRPARASRRGSNTALAASAAGGMTVVEALPPRLSKVDGYHATTRLSKVNG